MIGVGTTLCGFAMEREFLWKAWLYEAESLQASVKDEVRFFCAIETDSRGTDIFKSLTSTLEEIGGEYWFFSLDDGRTSITTSNRGRHLCTGFNLVSEWATANGATHLLQMAADTRAPADVLPKLLEVDMSAVACAVSTYFGDYSQHTSVPNTSLPLVFPPATSACVLLQREVFKTLKIRWDPDEGMTDDPSLARDVKVLLNKQVVTRKDCVAVHYPESISSIETRFPGLDMSVNHES